MSKYAPPLSSACQIVPQLTWMIELLPCATLCTFPSQLHRIHEQETCRLRKLPCERHARSGRFLTCRQNILLSAPMCFDCTSTGSSFHKHVFDPLYTYIRRAFTFLYWSTFEKERFAGSVIRPDAMFVVPAPQKALENKFGVEYE